MLSRIVETARAIGAHTIHLTSLPRNRAMQALVQSCDPDVRFETDPAPGVSLRTHLPRRSAGDDVGSKPSTRKATMRRWT